MRFRERIARFFYGRYGIDGVLWTSRGNRCVVDSAGHLIGFHGSQHIDLYSRGYTAVLDAVSVPVQKYRRAAAGK